MISFMSVTESLYKGESRTMMHGILKQIPLKAVDISTISSVYPVKLWCRRPATTVTNLSNSWNSACKVSGVFAFATTH